MQYDEPAVPEILDRVKQEFPGLTSLMYTINPKKNETLYDQDIITHSGRDHIFEKLEDLKKPLEFARGLLPPHVKGKNHLPYLGPLLDAGMAAIFAYEILEAIRILREPDFYVPGEEPDIEGGKLWVGPADDIILRKRGVEFVDGTAPGFAAVVGSCPDPETAKMIVEEYQRRSLYIFCAAHQNGTTVIVSAGNAGTDLDGGDRSAVRFNTQMSHAVGISALAPLNWAGDNGSPLYPASYTNFGTSMVDFGAPGGDTAYPGNEGCVVAGLARPCWVFDLVFSTGNGGWYWSAGTSMAAPHVAGAAALLYAVDSSLTHDEAWEALEDSAVDLGAPGFDTTYGHGLVQIDVALGAIEQLVAPPTETPTPTQTPTDFYTLTFP